MATSPIGVEPFDRERVSAIFDWGNSLVGDWLCDVAWLAFFAPWHPGLRALDVVREARERGGAAGLDLAGFDERLQACWLHIGLDGQRYSASIGSWADLESTARRTLQFAAEGFDRGGP